MIYIAKVNHLILIMDLVLLTPPYFDVWFFDKHVLIYVWRMGHSMLQFKQNVKVLYNVNIHFGQCNNYAVCCEVQNS